MPPRAASFNSPDGTTAGSSFFVDQSPTNALATGDSHTYIVNIDTNNCAQVFQLQATLVWTDPPGDPAAAIKLVNNLELVITNLDTGDLNYGAFITATTFRRTSATTCRRTPTTPPNIDTINNVQNILLPPPLGAANIR